MARRIAMIVTGLSNIWKGTTAGSWRLGVSNDWFLCRGEGTHEYKLTSRYEDKETAQALRKVVIWALNLQELNKD